MKESVFYPQADLLLQVLPFVHAESCFALKGGTALNFFVRNFPRLSVDIDLVYLPLEDRASNPARNRRSIATYCCEGGAGLGSKGAKATSARRKSPV